MGLIFLLLIMYALWKFIAEGYIWKFSVSVFGWAGMCVFLTLAFSGSRDTAFRIGGISLSWAVVIPTFVLFMASLYSDD